MTDHSKRLARLEAACQGPTGPTLPPFDPDRLTVEDRAELDDLRALLARVDVGPGPLDRRTDIRARLAALTDEELHRSGVLLRKGFGQERAEHDRAWGMLGMSPQEATR